MTEKPDLPEEERKSIACPFCTIQIDAAETTCPHCRQVLRTPEKAPPAPAPRKKEAAPRPGPREGRVQESLSSLWDRYGKWIKVAGPVLAAILLLFLVYGTWVGHKVTIVPNPDLPVKVKQSKKDGNVVFTVSVTNLGEDVPDLSLKSIGVVAEILHRDGRRQKKTFFPKSEYRGEGALLREETGTFDIEVPSKDLKEVILRSEVVDLGLGRTLITPGSGRESPSR